MKRALLPLLGLLIAGAPAANLIADPIPTTAPVLAARSAPRVEIFPFTAVSQPGQNDWIGRGIQESLQSDVSRSGASLITPAKTPAPTDDALTIARQNNADLAVIGSFQIVGDDIRVTGRLVETQTNNTIGGFSATGPQKNLFQIEDALGEQLRRLLPASAEAQRVAQAIDQASSQPPAVQTTTIYQQPDVYAQPSTVNNYYDTPPDSGYYYPAYPYYGYVNPYPFGFYGAIGVYGGGYYHRGFDRGYVGHGAPAFRGGFGTRSAPSFGGARGGFGGEHSFGGGGHGHR